MIKWIFFPTQKKILGNNSKKQKTKLEQTEIQYFFLINTLK
jgi:tRNA splicing ligase